MTAKEQTKVDWEQFYGDTMVSKDNQLLEMRLQKCVK